MDKQKFTQDELAQLLDQCWLIKKSAELTLKQRKVEHGIKVAVSRFSKRVRCLAHRKDVTNPKGLARYIGEKKYGKGGFKKLQEEGRKKKRKKK